MYFPAPTVFQTILAFLVVSISGWLIWQAVFWLARHIHLVVS